jgi:hypothetical protein
MHQKSDGEKLCEMYRRYDSYDSNQRSTIVRSDKKVVVISLKDGEKGKQRKLRQNVRNNHATPLLFQSVWAPFS